MTRHESYTSRASGTRQSTAVRVRRGCALAVGALLVAVAPAAAQRSDGESEVALHGVILMNGFRNSDRVNNSDVPTIALPGAPMSALGGTMRQTRLLVTVSNPEIGGGRVYAELDVDFAGGQQPSGGGRTHPLPRIRRAFGELRWREAELFLGQEAPPVFGLNPLSLASVAFPGFASSGNLWLWIPQIRGTVWANPDMPVRIGLEATVLAPSAGEPQDPFLTQPDRAERAARPMYEARAVARWQSGGRRGEAGIGGHVGWLVGDDGDLVTSRAAGALLSAPLGDMVELRAEVFTGRALAGLGGGAIGQNLAPGGTEGVRSRGGWAQLAVFPTGWLELAAGAGQDDPDDDDVAAGGRTRNRSWNAAVTLRRLPLVAALEYRWLRTEYGGAAGERATNGHVNLAVGIEF